MRIGRAGGGEWTREASVNFPGKSILRPKSPADTCVALGPDDAGSDLVTDTVLLIIAGDGSGNTLLHMADSPDAIANVKGLRAAPFEGDINLQTSDGSVTANLNIDGGRQAVYLGVPTSEPPLSGGVDVAFWLDNATPALKILTVVGGVKKTGTVALS